MHTLARFVLFFGVFAVTVRFVWPSSTGIVYLVAAWVALAVATDGGR